MNSPDSSEFKVLVVDDDHDILSLLDSWLKTKGIDHFLASSGQEALDICRRSPIDLIFLDIQMPVIDGFQALEAIKKILPDTRVVIITAFGDLSSYVKALNLGAVDFVNKPFDFDTLSRFLP